MLDDVRQQPTLLAIEAKVNQLVVDSTSCHFAWVLDERRTMIDPAHQASAPFGEPTLRLLVATLIAVLGSLLDRWAALPRFVPDLLPKVFLPALSNLLVTVPVQLEPRLPHLSLLVMAAALVALCHLVRHLAGHLAWSSLVLPIQVHR